MYCLHESIIYVSDTCKAHLHQVNYELKRGGVHFRLTIISRIFNEFSWNLIASFTRYA